MLSIEVEPTKATGVGTACLDAKRLSQRLGTYVTFQMAGIYFSIGPNANLKGIKEDYYDAKTGQVLTRH